MPSLRTSSSIKVRTCHLHPSYILFATRLGSGECHRLGLRGGCLNRHGPRGILFYERLIAELQSQREQAYGECKAQLTIGYAWRDKRARQPSSYTADDQAVKQSGIEVAAG